jgi:hypothetical protein
MGYGYIYFYQKTAKSWAQWNIPIIPELGRLRQEDPKFEVSLGNVKRSQGKRKLPNIFPKWL